MLLLNKRSQNAGVGKNLCEFLTSNNLRKLWFLFSFFWPLSWTNWRRFFRHLFSFLLGEVLGSKIGLFSLTTPENFHLYILLVSSKMRAASSNVSKRSNTNARYMQLFSEQLSKTTVWKLRMQPIVNVPFGLGKRFIMNDSHQQFYEWIEQ